MKSSTKDQIPAPWIHQGDARHERFSGRRDSGWFCYRGGNWVGFGLAGREFAGYLMDSSKQEEKRCMLHIHIKLVTRVEQRVSYGSFLPGLVQINVCKTNNNRQNKIYK
ncbi:hypothetical protein LXL04_004230 [Taraxacum kok-saghyz]